MKKTEGGGIVEGTNNNAIFVVVNNAGYTRDISCMSEQAEGGDTKKKNTTTSGRKEYRNNPAGRQRRYDKKRTLVCLATDFVLWQESVNSKYTLAWLALA